ncbi:hypothetical protein [Labilithrix luteola]|nr:hypothetical protein [Labilithrix luteola]
MHPFLRYRLPLILALAAGGVWLGCGTDNGDASGQDPEGYPPDETDGEDGHTGGNALDASSGGKDASKPDASDGGDLPVPDGGKECVDTDDPGGSEALAKALGDTPDSDDTTKTVTGVLNGVLDTDFYSLSVTDTFGSILEAHFKTPTSGIELCVFLKCKDAKVTTNFKGCTGGVETTSSIGMSGCCATGPSEATPKWSCGGFTTTDDSANFYVRIKQTADACTPYDWTYTF